MRRAIPITRFECDVAGCERITSVPEAEGEPPGWVEVEAAAARPRLTRQEALDVLGDYPDADLSAFDIEGDPDVDALAAEAVAGKIEKLAGVIRRAEGAYLT